MEHAQGAAGILGSGVISESSQPQEWERRISEKSEQLYRSRLVRWFFLLWTYVGNLALLGLAAAAFALVEDVPSWGVVLLVLVPLGSIAGSATLLYRQHFAVRAVEAELRELRRAYSEHLLEEFASGDVFASHKRYRTLLPEVIAEYRVESTKQLRRYNLVQVLVIAGSIGSAAATVAALSSVEARWVAVVLSTLVAVAAAFAGHAKYRERSASLQRTADSLEREYQSVELRVGRYRRFGDEREAYAEFADQVEALRAEESEAATAVGANSIAANSRLIGP